MKPYIAFAAFTALAPRAGIVSEAGRNAHESGNPSGKPPATPLKPAPRPAHGADHK
jgi:hypothetical protein